MTDLGTLPGGYYSAAYGINDRGQVVGWSPASENNEHAFLFEHGVMTDLGMLPSVAEAMNAARIDEQHSGGVLERAAHRA